ncbi:unnamed protein product [Withania somnifera]
MDPKYSYLPQGIQPEWLNNAWELRVATTKCTWASFMGLYAFASVLICWVLWAHRMAFGTHLMPIIGKSEQAMTQIYLLSGSLLGRMIFYATSFSYTIGAHSIWVGPRHSHDRQHFPPNNIILMLGGAGLIWMGWTGSNGGSPLASKLITSLVILNTHICTVTSLLVWLSMDMIFYNRSSVIGAVLGMITGLVCITPGAGMVESWAAIPMGISSGSISWFTMMVLHKKSFFQKVDDTLGVFHTCCSRMFYNSDKYGPGFIYSLIDGDIKRGLRQMVYQLLGALFITIWNVVATSLICIFISRIVKLRLHEDDLEIGDDAVHGEEAYALWGDGKRDPPCFNRIPKIPSFCRCHATSH